MSQQLATYGGGLTRHVAAFDASLFARFTDYADVKETTLKGYVTNIRQFAKWLSENGVTQPTREDVKAYKAELSQSGYKASTQAAYLRAVKQFFKWTASEGLYPNIADNIKGAKVRGDVHKRDDMTAHDLQRVFDTLEQSEALTPEQKARDRAILILAYQGGLRTVEIERANVCDLESSAGQNWLYVQGKGRDEKDSRVSVSAHGMEALREYLGMRGNPKPSEPLFTSTSRNNAGQRMSRDAISRRIKRAFVSAGYDSSRLTAHSLRHSCASLQLEAGRDPRTIQKAMRHSNLATTEVYMHDREASTDRTAEMLDALVFAPEGEGQARAEMLERLERAAKAMTNEQLAELLEKIAA